MSRSSRDLPASDHLPVAEEAAEIVADAVDAAVVKTKVVKHPVTVRWKALAAPEAADVAANAKSLSTTLRPSLVSSE